MLYADKNHDFLIKLLRRERELTRLFRTTNIWTKGTQETVAPRVFSVHSNPSSAVVKRGTGVLPYCWAVRL